MPPPGVGPFAISVTVNPKDIARINRTLDKYQGTTLHKRMDRAAWGAAGLAVGPMRAAAPRSGTPGHSGTFAKTVKRRALRRRFGEIAAYETGPQSPLNYIVTRGTKAHSLKTKRAGKSKFAVFPDGNVRATVGLHHPGANSRPFVDTVYNAIGGQLHAYQEHILLRLA